MRSQKLQLVNMLLYCISSNSYLYRTTLFLKTLCINFYIWYFNIYVKFKSMFKLPLCWGLLYSTSVFYFCYKVVWQRSSSHGIYNLLLLTFCMSYWLIFSFRLFFGFCFLLVKLIIDVDCCFVYTSCYHHTKWHQTF